MLLPPIIDIVWKDAHHKDLVHGRLKGIGERSGAKQRFRSWSRRTKTFTNQSLGDMLKLAFMQDGIDHRIRVNERGIKGNVRGKL